MTKRVIKLGNVRSELEKGGVIQRERLYWSTNKWKQYKLLKDVHLELSNKDIITIPKGFEWDLSSVPRLFWAIMPPDGDFEIGALIHDYIYQTKNYSRKFGDLEMFIWSKVTNSTSKWSIKNIDNYVRYYIVRLFGGFVWKR